jgi:hypothetical protein
MSKAQFFLPLLLLLFSCAKERKTALEPASGNINTIAVIIDDQLWNGEIGDSIRNKFAAPIIGLQQEEPRFTINQYPARLLEGFMTHSRNILVIKKEPRSRFEIRRNEYANPQNVVHISGNTISEILALIEKHAPEVLQLIHDTEIAEAQRMIDTALLDDESIEKQFRLSIRIPSDYRVALRGKKFIWLKKEIISGNTSLLIYEVPIKCLTKNANAIDNIIKMRDSIGSLYVHGSSSMSRMITEEAFAPYLTYIKIDGRKAFETRGTWELRDDYMSGPFVNYAIIDRPRKRIVVLEGFCYAPSKEKRDLMHELEAIIKTVKF